MSNVLQYPDSDTLFQYLHSLGYTKNPPQHIAVYDSNEDIYVLIKDTSDNTIYDSDNQTWVSDITGMNLYKYVGLYNVYIGDTQIQCRGYSTSLYSTNISHVFYEDEIQSLQYLYNTYGITNHPCVLYEVDQGEIVVWYDEQTGLYWDVNSNTWLTEPPPEPEHNIPNMYASGPVTFGNVYNFEQDDGTEQTGQFEGGTMRIFGTNKNYCYPAIQRTCAAVGSIDLTSVNLVGFFEPSGTFTI